MYHKGEAKCSLVFNFKIFLPFDIHFASFDFKKVVIFKAWNNNKATERERMGFSLFYNLIYVLRFINCLGLKVTEII